MTEGKIIKWEGQWDAPVQNQNNFSTMLISKASSLEDLIPEGTGLNLRTLTTTALECAIDNPGLLNCSTISLFLGVKKAAEFGLSLSKELGHAYLVPYYNKRKRRKDAQLIIGYKGWVALVYRATRVTMLDTSIVYSGDDFSIEKGTTPKLVHKSNLATAHGDGDMTHFYAVAHFPDAPPRFEVMTADEVKAIRSRSPGGSQGPWQTDFGQMGCKTVLLRLRKNLPVSREGLFAKALEYEHQTSGIVTHRSQALPEITGEDRLARLKNRIEGGPVPADAEDPEILEGAIEVVSGDGAAPEEMPPDFYEGDSERA